jgi:hypothetical protein
MRLPGGKVDDRLVLSPLVARSSFAFQSPKGREGGARVQSSATVGGQLTAVGAAGAKPAFEPGRHMEACGLAGATTVPPTSFSLDP